MISSGKGALKSSGAYQSLLSNPRRLAGCGDSMGIKRATGLPALVITTSSPAITRLSKRDSSVLASRMLTLIMAGFYGLEVS
jgi:hypothetical protein